MEDKYYIPKIEEFHVGFEFERCCISPVKDPRFGIMIKKEVFESRHWSNVSWNVDFDVDLADGKIRVKCLDKEDIESFGFKRSDIDYYFTSDKFHLQHFNEINYVVIKSVFTDWVVFDGRIKNKSELKTLLAQLEVI